MNGFKTKLDASNNRQFKQIENSYLDLSGVTYTGLVYSGLTFGADPYNSGNTEEFFSLSGSFSGNNFETIYFMPDPRMAIADSILPILTTSYTASTFSSGNVFVGYNQNIIDGETYYLNYSGVNFTFSINSLIESPPNNFTGNLTINNLKILSADSIDWNARRIWLVNNGILETESLILTKDLNFNDLLFIKNTNGDVGGYPLSAVTGGSSSVNYWVSSNTINNITVTNRGNQLLGTNSTAISLSGVSLGNNVFNQGFKTSGNGDYSHAEGSTTITNGLASHAEGTSTTSTGDYSHSEGVNTISTGNYSHAEGSNTTSIGVYSHVEGFNNTSNGDGSHSEGYVSKSNGVCAHSEGVDTNAFGNYSHAEGSSTTSIGVGSHSEGISTKSNGNYSHAEGYLTTTFGSYSHTEGVNSTSLGNYSHAEGNNTLSSGESSHAEGLSCHSIGTYSHAEGINTRSIGEHSHTEGNSTTSIGLGSYAGGINTTSIGNYSKSMGNTNITYGDYTLIGGSNNLINSGSTNSSILASSGCTINSNVINSIILGSSNRTINENNTIYIQNLNQKGERQSITLGDETLSANTFSTSRLNDINFNSNEINKFLTFTNLSGSTNLFTNSLIIGTSVFEGTVFMKSISNLYDQVTKFYFVVKNGTSGFLSGIDKVVKNNFLDTSTIDFSFDGTNLIIDFNYDTITVDIILIIKEINNSL